MNGLNQEKKHWNLFCLLQLNKAIEFIFQMFHRDNLGQSNSSV